MTETEPVEEAVPVDSKHVLASGERGVDGTDSPAEANRGDPPAQTDASVEVGWFSEPRLATLDGGIAETEVVFRVS